jgi:hypothetical protein
MNSNTDFKNKIYDDGKLREGICGTIVGNPMTKALLKSITHRGGLG